MFRLRGPATNQRLFAFPSQPESRRSVARAGMRNRQRLKRAEHQNHYVFQRASANLPQQRHAAIGSGRQLLRERCEQGIALSDLLKPYMKRKSENLLSEILASGFDF